jgi:hypothetical protein
MNAQAPVQVAAIEPDATSALAATTKTDDRPVMSGKSPTSFAEPQFAKI